MGTLLAIVASIAISLAADDLIQRANRMKANSEGVSTDDVLRLVNQVLDRAKQYEGKKAQSLNIQLNKLNSKLSAIPYNQGVGAVKDKIQDARRILNNQITATQNQLTKLAIDEANAQQEKLDIQTRASSLATASDSYKTSKAGREDLAQIKIDADKYVSNIEKINKGVENYV